MMSARDAMVVLACGAIMLCLAFVATSRLSTYTPYTEADALRDLDREVYGHPTRSYSWLEDGIVTQDELRRIQSGELR